MSGTDGGARYARAAAAIAQLPADDASDPDAVAIIRQLVDGDGAARAGVRAVAIADRRTDWRESDVDAGRLVDAVLGIVAADWPTAPHLPGPPDPDPLPLAALPPVLRAHVASVAAATQTPADLAALLSLAAVSAAIGGRVDVDVDARGWREPANIYAAAILPPASRKSPVYSAMTTPLLAWERERVVEMTPSHRRARDRAEVAARAVESTIRAAAAGKATVDEVEAARVQATEAEDAVPVIPRILASDATPEALVRLMAEQGGRIALLAPEADPLGIADGRYSESGARVDELLRAWSAEPIRVDRVGREPVHVERPALTLGLTMQPAALDALTHGRTMRGRGLWGRVLWAVAAPRARAPDAPAATCRRWTGAAERQYDRVLRALLDAADGDSAGFAGAIRTLRLSDDALDLLYR